MMSHDAEFAPEFLPDGLTQIATALGLPHPAAWTASDLAAKARQLRRRVVELEAERPNHFREEFGVHWRDGDEVEPASSLAAARRIARICGVDEGYPVRREVRELSTAWRAV